MLEQGQRFGVTQRDLVAYARLFDRRLSYALLGFEGAVHDVVEQKVYYYHWLRRHGEGMYIRIRKWRRSAHSCSDLINLLLEVDG